jgi:hypothetical protein
MNSVQKFFTLLGFDDTCLNAEQILVLISLLLKEQDIILSKNTDIVGIMDNIISIYIDKMETNGFKHITEQDIIEVLK